MREPAMLSLLNINGIWLTWKTLWWRWTMRKMRTMVMTMTMTIITIVLILKNSGWWSKTLPPGELLAQDQVGPTHPSWRAEVGKYSPGHHHHYHHHHHIMSPIVSILLDARRKPYWEWGRGTLKPLSCSPHLWIPQNWKSLTMVVYNLAILTCPRQFWRW